MRILLATDGSRSADLAVDLVLAIPWPDGSSIRVVSVVPSGANLSLDLRDEQAGLPDLDRYRDPTVRSHAVALADAERDLSLAHPHVLVERFLLRGRAASQIVEEARAFGADLIVLGNRGHSGIETMLLGSVSAEVVDHAPCAVLLARSAERGSIAFADDGSSSARVAASVLEHLPLPPGTPITVLTVTDDEGFPYETALAPGLYNEAITMYEEDMEEADRRAGAIAAAAVDRFEQVGFRAKQVLRKGDPALEIVNFAREQQTGLLVLGTRGNTGLKRLLLGSVARNVLIHAPCSVLIVRQSVSPPADGEELIAASANHS